MACAALQTRVCRLLPCSSTGIYALHNILFHKLFNDVSQYLPQSRVALVESGITLSSKDRADMIWRAAEEAASQAGGKLSLLARQELLPEVTHLVEAPHVLLGTFDRSFLSLPPYVF